MYARKIEPTNLRCFLAPLNAITFGRWENVTVDTWFGPYYSCVPRYTRSDFSKWDVHDYACNQGHKVFLNTSFVSCEYALMSSVFHSHCRT